jgi:hypothetical protein
LSGFSIAFENDYINVLTLLQQAGLPLPSVQRGASLPLIVAGGVSCFLNPEPITPFIDCFLIGEAEGCSSPFLRVLIRPAIEPFFYWKRPAICPAFMYRLFIQTTIMRTELWLH